MGQAIGDILPLALGIAISPIPVIAAILMLLSPKAKGTSVAFLVGWVAGIIVIVVAFSLLLAALIPAGDEDAPRPIAATIQLLLGAGLLVLAVRQWRSRPRSGEPAKLPHWMGAIDSMTVGRGLVLGFLLAAVNPKNLLLGAAAGVSIGASGLDPGIRVVVTIAFVAIAAASVAIPVLAYLIASSRIAGPLQGLRDWLERNNATVMSVLLLVIGVVVIGKGLGNF